MRLQDINKKLRVQGEKLAEIETTSGLEAAESSEEKAEKAKTAREELGQVGELKMAAAADSFREFIAITVGFPDGAGKGAICASPGIKLGIADIPVYGKGEIWACVSSRDERDFRTGYGQAESFVTEVWFRNGDARLAQPGETFRFARGDKHAKPECSGWLVLPRQLKWAEEHDGLVQREVKVIDKLCEQAATTLNMLKAAAANPELNPVIAERIQASPQALHWSTSVVKLPSQ